MGTRADFYVGRGAEAEWLGSIAYDGYPDGQPAAVFGAADERGFRDAVAALIAGLDHGTAPEQGWPWPWPDSSTTDYAYAWDGGVWASCGYLWFDPTKGEPDDSTDGPKAVFPDMTSRQAFTLGRRSGVLVLGVK